MSPQLNERLQLTIKALQDLGAREIYIFGSFGTERFDEDHSDIDLAVKGLPDRNFYRAGGVAMSIFKREVDLIDLDDASLFNDYLQKKGMLRRVA
jgi:predicted nucleotidyltransferase